MVLRLSEADIAKVLTYEQLIPAMEQALATLSNGEAIHLSETSSSFKKLKFLNEDPPTDSINGFDNVTILAVP